MAENRDRLGRKINPRQAQAFQRNSSLGSLYWTRSLLVSLREEALKTKDQVFYEAVCNATSAFMPLFNELDNHYKRVYNLKLIAIPFKEPKEKKNESQ